MYLQQKPDGMGAPKHSSPHPSYTLQYKSIVLFAFAYVSTDLCAKQHCTDCAPLGIGNLKVHHTHASIGLVLCREFN